MKVPIKFKKKFLYEIFKSDKVYQLSDLKIEEIFAELISSFVKYESVSQATPTSYRGSGFMQIVSKYYDKIGININENLDISYRLPIILSNKMIVEIQAKEKLENVGYVFGRYGDINSPKNQPKLSVKLFTIYREKETNEMLPHYTFTGHCYVDLLNQYNILKTLDSGKPIHVRV